MKKALELLKEIDEPKLDCYCGICKRNYEIAHAAWVKVVEAIALLEAKPEPGELVKRTRKCFSFDETNGARIHLLCDEIERLEAENAFLNKRMSEEASKGMERMGWTPCEDDKAELKEKP